MDSAVQAQIFAVLKDLITLAGTILLSITANYVHKHYTAKQLHTATNIAKIAVTFVEQTAESLGIKLSSQKYQMALEKAKELATHIGIHLTDTQWQALIEAAVGEAKDIWQAVTSDTSKALPVKTTTTASSDSVTTSINPADTSTK